MIQNQLIEYINAHLKLGTSRDAIKSALVGAGWPAQDVDDTLKSTEPAGKPAAAAGAAGTPSAGGPQVIKVSDLVSGSPSIMSSSSSPAASSTASPFPSPTGGRKEPPKSPVTVGPTTSTGPMPASKPSPFTSSPVASSSPIGKPMGTMMSGDQPIKVHASRGPLITEIVLGVIVIIALAAAGFFFFQNQSLTGQLSSLNGESASVNAKLAALTSETDASTTALAAESAALQGTVQELETELSFYAPAPSSTPGATTTGMVSGTLAAGGKYGYVIIGAYGAKIQILNARSSTSTAAALAPIATSTSVSQFQGVYIPGSGGIILTQVDSTTIQ